MKLDHIDIHSHLNLSPLFEKRDEILVKMKEQNIGTVTVGIDLETSQKAITIAEENPEHCWAIVGVHPGNIKSIISLEGVFNQNDWEIIKELSQHKQVIAIGETGLDYFRNETDEIKEQQKLVFKKHIELASEIQKPLMLHVRSSKGSDDAYYDALKLLQEMNYTGKADFHFFSGSKKCMQDIIKSGYCISVDGPITFVSEYDEMIRECPLEKIMIETDAPYAAPVPYRGKTCEPWMVIEVCNKIAEIKGLEIAVVREQMMKNSREFFGI